MSQQLWQRMLDRLERLGWLPLRYQDMTPAELAQRVSQDFGDQRVHRFVWDYFYPLHYGLQPGSLSEAEAARLVDSLGGADPSPAPAVPVPGAPPCQLCGSPLGVSHGE